MHNCIKTYCDIRLIFYHMTRGNCDESRLFIIWREPSLLFGGFNHALVIVALLRQDSAFKRITRKYLDWAALFQVLIEAMELCHDSFMACFLGLVTRIGSLF